MIRTDMLLVKDRYQVKVDILRAGVPTGAQVYGKALAHRYNGNHLFSIQVCAQFGKKSRTAWCKPKFVHRVVTNAELS